MMEEFNSTYIATTLGRIWCEELEDIIGFENLIPMDAYGIIADAASGDWVNYLMGKEIERDLSKISELASAYYEVDRLPEEIFANIIRRVRYEYKEYHRMNLDRE